MVTNRDRKLFGSRRKNSKICSDEWRSWRFWSVFRHFGTHFPESFRMSKSSWMMDPTHSREMPSCSAIDLAKFRQSSKNSSWIWSIISGVVTFWVVQHGAHHRWKNHHVTQFLTVAYDGEFSHNVYIRMAWISFGALPCRKKKPWWQFASRCCWNRARCPTCFLSASVTREDLQFNTWTDPSFQWHYRFLPMTWEVGRAKDLSAPPRIFKGH